MLTRKVFLSNSEIVFNLKSAGLSTAPDRFNICIDIENYDMETVEKAFTGNDIIRIVEIEDTTGEDYGVEKYYDWTVISSIAKDNQFYIGEDPDTHEHIFISVWSINLERADINKRMSDIEETVDDILNVILG